MESVSQPRSPLLLDLEQPGTDEFPIMEQNLDQDFFTEDPKIVPKPPLHVTFKDIKDDDDEKKSDIKSHSKKKRTREPVKKISTKKPRAPRATRRAKTKKEPSTDGNPQPLDPPKMADKIAHIMKMTIGNLADRTLGANGAIIENFEKDAMLTSLLSDKLMQYPLFLSTPIQIGVCSGVNVVDGFTKSRRGSVTPIPPSIQNETVLILK